MRKEKSPFVFVLLTAFFILSLLVTKQATRSFDLTVTQAIQHYGSKWLDYVMYLFTMLGSIEFSCFAILTVCWYLYQKYQWPGVFIYLFFFMALSGVEYLWKYIVTYTPPGPDFNRNPFHFGLVAVGAPYSFPSGHVFRSAFLLGIWYQRLTQEYVPAHGNVFAQKATIVAVASLIGLSRIYLGDHWMSDVVGGFLLAGIGLLLVSQTPHHELRPA